MQDKANDKQTTGPWVSDMIQNGDDTDEFREGKQARNVGALLSACPYRRGLSRLRWQDGWLAAADDDVGG